ncbi:MAG: linear amide C-N hydrolase [Flavonifractor plautii]
MHETTTKRPGRAGKYIRRALLALAAVILAAVLVLLALFQAELRTLNTIERVDDTDLFTMTYLGDYGLDDFLAQGGASNDNELLDFLMQKLLKGLPLRFDIPDLGCSTFAAETPEGDAIFGRNFDMYYSPALFVRTAPEDGYRSISMVNLSYIGFGEDKLPTSLLDSLLTLAAPYVPLDGLNEKGLAVGVLLIDTEPTDQQTDKPDITTTTAIRLLLDRAATVDEALALLSQYDMHASANSCYHFQIADAAGRAVVVEYIGDEMNVGESPRATNFLLTEGDWDFGRGQDRFAVLEETMEASGGVLTEEEGMALLQAVSQQPQPGKDSSTQWSCLYNQVRGTVDIAVAMDYDSLYHFAIDELAQARRICGGYFSIYRTPRPAGWSAHPPELHAMGGFQQGGQLRPAVEARPSAGQGENRWPPSPRRGCILAEHAAGLATWATRRRRAPGWDSGGKSRAQQHLKPPVGGQALGVPCQLHRAAQLFPGHRQHIGRQIQPLSGRSPKRTPPPAAALPCRSPRPIPSRGESGKADPATQGTAHGHGCRSGRCHRSRPAGQRLGQSAFYSRS